jgi:hypothetical protein
MTKTIRNQPILQFLGAAGSASVPNFLLRSGRDQRVPDCGLFQEGIEAAQIIGVKVVLN